MYTDIATNGSQSMALHQPDKGNACVCVSQQVYDVAVFNTSDHERRTALSIIGEGYGNVHGLLSLLVCAFGIPMNVLNIWVLTRKHMRTPVNCILTWLAVFDLFTMISYVPYVLHFHCIIWECDLRPSETQNSLGWMTFMIFHVDFASTTHTISIWLGVTLAMFRSLYVVILSVLLMLVLLSKQIRNETYKHIFSPAKGHLTRVRRLIRARIAVFVVVIMSVMMMIPNYMMNKLTKEEHLINPDTNETVLIYNIDSKDLLTDEVELITQLNMWFQCALAKLLPCFLMVVYGGLLVRTLRTNIRMLNNAQSTRTQESIYPLSQADHSPDHHYTEDHLLKVHSVDETADTSKENHSDQSASGESEDLLCCNRKVQVKRPPTSNFVKAVNRETGVQRSPSNVRVARPVPSRHHDNSRTTRMLLVVITLFLITELPQAILIILSATIPMFFANVYQPLGDIMDIVALVNNGINFLLYCIMSRDFRTTLVDMMRSTVSSASRMPNKITTTLYRPTVAIFDRSQKAHGTLIVRTKEYSV